MLVLRLILIQLETNSYLLCIKVHTYAQQVCKVCDTPLIALNRIYLALSRKSFDYAGFWEFQIFAIAGCQRPFDP